MRRGSIGAVVDMGRGAATTSLYARIAAPGLVKRRILSSMADRVERLTNLLAVLLETRQRPVVA